MYEKVGSEGHARVISGDLTVVNDPRMIEALEVLRRVSRRAEPAAARKTKSWADATTAVGPGEVGMQFIGDRAKGALSVRWLYRRQGLRLQPRARHCRPRRSSRRTEGFRPHGARSRQSGGLQPYQGLAPAPATIQAGSTVADGLVCR
jgi:hypothetical protein